MIRTAPELDAAEQTLKAVNVHRLGKTVANGLTDKRMIWDLALTCKILRTGDLVGEYRPDQVLGAHAGQLRWHLLAAAKARQRERDTDHPTPARGEHRQVEQGLGKHRPHRIGMQIARDLLERKAVRLRQRDHDVILSGGCL